MTQRSMVKVVVKFVVALGILGSLMSAGGAPLDFASKPNTTVVR